MEIWNTGIPFLFDHVVPQWPAGPLRSNHYNFHNRNLSNNRILPNNRRKSINQIFIIIRHFSINDRNISIKHELNTNKSINRKIPIILTARFNRIMLKEIFARICSRVLRLCRLLLFRSSTAVFDKQIFFSRSQSSY